MTNKPIIYRFGETSTESYGDLSAFARPKCDTGQPCKPPYCWICPLGETPLTDDLDPEIHNHD
jgi:hypothetical protein